jgi:hypothetical protein
VGVLKAGRRVDLAEEAPWTKCCSELRAQDLERDRSVVVDIVSEIDRSHPTAPELSLYEVAAGQSVLKAFQGLDQADESDWDISRV